MRRPDWMLAQLPVGMVQDEFFARFVSIFQELGSSLLADADNVERIVDVTVTPDPFVRYLGSWTGAPALDASLPVELQREVVRSWARMLAWRGTRRGLAEFLSLVCDAPVQVEDSGGVGDAFLLTPAFAWVHVRVPSSGWLAEKDFAALVRDEVPAHVYLELWVGDRRLLPPAAAAAVASPVSTPASAPAGVPASTPAGMPASTPAGMPAQDTSGDRP